MSSYLWVEKYRPSSLDTYIGNDHLKSKVRVYLESGDLPHLLFFGKAGTGKTTLAKILVKNMKNQYGIKTFAVGFTIAAGNRNNYEDLADAGGTDDPLYADDEKELLTRLTDGLIESPLFILIVKFH